MTATGKISAKDYFNQKYGFDIIALTVQRKSDGEKNSVEAIPFFQVLEKFDLKNLEMIDRMKRDLNHHVDCYVISGPFLKSANDFLAQAELVRSTMRAGKLRTGRIFLRRLQGLHSDLEIPLFRNVYVSEIEFDPSSQYQVTVNDFPLPFAEAEFKVVTSFLMEIFGEMFTIAEAWQQDEREMMELHLLNCSVG